MQHHVGHRLADQPGGGEVGRRPGLRRRLHHLMPLGEGAAGRELGGVVADDHRLGRIAAPGHGADVLRPEPDQIFAGRGRDRRGEDAAGDRDEGGEARLLEAQRGAGDDRAVRGGACGAIQPAAEFAQFEGAGHLAGGQDLALEEQRGAGRADRLQQRYGHCRTGRRASRPRARSPRSCAVRAGARTVRPGPGRSFRARRCAWPRLRPAARRPRGSRKGRSAASSWWQATRPQSLPPTMSETTSVAPTPMFRRYCTWIGDMLRRKHSDMSSSSPAERREPGRPGAPAHSPRRPAPARGCAHRAGGRSAGCRWRDSGCRDRLRARACGRSEKTSPWPSSSKR